MRKRNVIPETSRLLLAVYIVSLLLSLVAGGVPLYFYFSE